MKKHQKRLKKEHDKLAARIERLSEFLWSDQYNKLLPVEQNVLEIQLLAMETYLGILSARLSHMRSD